MLGVAFANMGSIMGLSALEERRRVRLRELIERYGSSAKLADALGCTPGYISQLLTKRRPVTEKTARKFERTLDLPEYWFDQRHTDAAADKVEPGPQIRARVPLISWTTAGNWGEVVDHFTRGDAEDWVVTTANVGPHAFALRIRGESMAPTIPDGAIVVVDPDAEPRHRSIVIVRQNYGSEATCKRLIYEGDQPMIRPDNPAYVGQIAPLADDARIVGVVRQVVVDLE